MMSQAEMRVYDDCIRSSQFVVDDRRCCCRNLSTGDQLKRRSA